MTTANMATAETAPAKTATRLIQAASGPLAGHTVAPINLEKFADFKERTYAAGVTYGFGSKDPNPGSGHVGFEEIDCSGFARTLLMYAGEGAFDEMPDGSFDQGDWFAAQGFKPSDPANCQLADGHIRVCIHHPDRLDRTGHIWLVVGNDPVHTVESYGGHGPGERRWNARLSGGETLDQLATLCFVLM